MTPKYDDIYYMGLVESLRRKSDFYDACKNETDTLRKCLLCKAHLSSNQWSVLMENFIKEKFNISKRNNNVSGDGITTKDYNIEIKVSLGTDNGQVHFVQIRPDHKVDYYLMLVYNVHEGDLGKIYWLLCNADELYALLPEYGGYAHGTVERLGKITSDNICGRNCEYALRPNPMSKRGTKARRLWDTMVDMFGVNEEDVINTIC